MGGKPSLCQADAQQAVATLVREWEMFIYWNQELRRVRAAEPSFVTIAVSVL